MISSSKDSQIDLVVRLDAMCAQEESAGRSINYFQEGRDVDASSRGSLVTYLRALQSSININPDVLWIAMSYLDRYLSSGKGKSPDALNDRHLLQLVAITAFYTAVKVHESSVELDADTLAELCHGYYETSEILAIEQDMLFALDWRVTSPTPVEFATVYMELLPERVVNSPSIMDGLLDTTRGYVETSVSDFYFSFFKPSVVGAACLVSSVTGGGVAGKEDDASVVLTSSERRTFWERLARVGNVDLLEVMDVQSKLLAGRPLVKPKKVEEVMAYNEEETAAAEESATCSSSEVETKVTSSTRTNLSDSDRSSSPVSVFRNSFMEDDEKASSTQGSSSSEPGTPKREEGEEEHGTSNNGSHNPKWVEVDIFHRSSGDQEDQKQDDDQDRKKGNKSRLPFSRLKSSFSKRVRRPAAA